MVYDDKLRSIIYFIIRDCEKKCEFKRVKCALFGTFLDDPDFLWII